MKTAKNKDSTIKIAVFIILLLFIGCGKSEKRLLPKANKYMDNENFDKALVLYKRALELNPESTKANCGLIFATFEKKNENDIDKLMREYEVKSIMHPENGLWIYCLGRFHEHKKEYDEALAQYIKASELGFDGARCYSEIGRVFYSKNMLDEAIKQLEKAVELNFEYASPYYWLGQVYTKKKLYDNALPMFEKYVELEPKDYDGYLQVGLTYEDKNMLDKAIKFYKKAAKLGAKDERCWYFLGTAYKKKELYDKATVCFKKGLELNPESSLIFGALASVYLEEKTHGYRSILDAMELGFRLAEKYSKKLNEAHMIALYTALILNTIQGDIGHMEIHRDEFGNIKISEGKKLAVNYRDAMRKLKRMCDIYEEKGVETEIFWQKWIPATLMEGEEKLEKANNLSEALFICKEINERFPSSEEAVLAKEKMETIAWQYLGNEEAEYYKRRINDRYQQAGLVLHGSVQVKAAKEKDRFDLVIPINVEYSSLYLKKLKEDRATREQAVKNSETAKKTIIGGLAYGFARTMIPVEYLRLSLDRREFWGPKERPPTEYYKKEWWLPPIIDEKNINSIEIELWASEIEPGFGLDLFKKRDEYGNVIQSEKEPPQKIGSLKLFYNSIPEEMSWANWSYASEKVKEKVWQRAIVKVE